MADYKFTGMRRSGNHAVILWLIKNLGGSLVWHNNAACTIRPSTHWYEDGKPCEEEIKTDHAVMSLEDQPYSDGVLIIRDIYNLAASRIKTAELLPDEEKSMLKVDSDFVDLWIQHMSSTPSILVRYDEWALWTSYRSKILKQLGINKKEKPLREKVLQPGVPSSFPPSLSVQRRYEHTKLPKWLLDREDVRNIVFSRFGWTLSKSGFRV